MVGFVDDWIKVRHRRSLGLNKRAKLAAQIVVALGFALLAEHWAGVNTHLSFTRWNSMGIDLGQLGWIVWAVVDRRGHGQRREPHRRARRAGLGVGHFLLRHAWPSSATGSSATIRIYHVASALDLALASMALAGACLGFLWWNAAPARIFMGDTGSLAIGVGPGRAVVCR